MAVENKLVLASTSPRRREILELAGYSFSCVSPDCDESTDEKDPARLVALLSQRKAAAALEGFENGTVVISADTVVALEGRILGKPGNAEKAAEMLRALSGKTHSVFTGFTVTDGNKSVTGTEETKVTMRVIREDEAEMYIASGSPLDKAGAYGIQDAGGMFVSGISGDWYSVMGLPLCAVSEVLRQSFGVLPEIR